MLQSNQRVVGVGQSTRYWGEPHYSAFRIKFACDPQGDNNIRRWYHQFQDTGYYVKLFEFLFHLIYHLWLNSRQSEEDYFSIGTVLHEKLDIEKIEKLHDKFQNAPKKRMSCNELQDILKKTAGVDVSQTEFKVIFLKMNSSGSGFVDWDEFVTHLLLEFQEKQLEVVQQRLRLPLEGLPILFYSHHLHPVVRIAFQPTSLKEHTIDYKNGKYMTVSREGMVNYWSIDMKKERTVYSFSPALRVHTTWITDLVCLPDVNVVCISSTERDLRFYSIVAKQFQMHLQITNLKFTVVRMHYFFSKDVNEKSRLILGDTAGNVMVISFTTMFRGPFRRTLGAELIHFRYEELLKETSFIMKVREFPRVHNNWVSQVSYYSCFHSFVSCAVCPENALCICDENSTKSPYVYHVASGVSCFTFSEETHTLVSGGPDCIVRAWNVLVPSKANSVFYGHHAPVCSVVLQDDMQMILSLDTNRSVKVWDIVQQVCIQTYSILPPKLNRQEPMVTFHNAETGQLIVCSVMIAVLSFGQHMDSSLVPEFTHTAPVSVALYNPLFQCIVTVGMDSCIAVWDPRTNKRKCLISNAHTHKLYGERKPVEITAATFDLAFQVLVTGARDGTIKMWNFNTGMSLGQMTSGRNQKITSLVWIRSRILSVGWDKQVTEYEGNAQTTHGKTWDSRHEGDILCAAVYPPQTLATGSYTGELVLWALETGQMYQQYNVTNLGQADAIPDVKAGDSNIVKGRKFGGIQLPAVHAAMRKTSVYAMVFLLTRPMKVDTGTLLVALGDGTVQVWSHHIGGGYMGHFLAIHTQGDWVMSMTTDSTNKYLFTGHVVGYIKVWLMQNYMQAEADCTKVMMPLLRLQFPFLLRDRITGRAKRAIRGQPLPVLLSSHRGHVSSVNHLEYISQPGIVISASSDHTVRLWTLGGLYVGTLGSTEPWPSVLHQTKLTEIRIPPDISRVASSTTMKVLEGGRAEQRRRIVTETTIQEVRQLPKQPVAEVYGYRAKYPVLGKFFTLPMRTLPVCNLKILGTAISPESKVLSHKDTVRPHTAAVTQHALHGVQLLWPERSLSLTPIQLLQAMMMRQELTGSPGPATTIVELRKQVERAWDSVSQDSIRQLYD